MRLLTTAVEATGKTQLSRKGHARASVSRAVEFVVGQ